MSDGLVRIVPSCVEALENYRQADMDGIMVLASRQAIHETIDAYWARVETCAELEAKLAKAVDVIAWALSAWDDHNKYGHAMQGDWVYDARAAIAEINGGGDT